MISSTLRIPASKRAKSSVWWSVSVTWVKTVTVSPSLAISIWASYPMM